jgi:hypothetical protein
MSGRKRELDDNDEPAYTDEEEEDVGVEPENKKKKSSFKLGGDIADDQKSVVSLWKEKVGDENKRIEDIDLATSFPHLVLTKNHQSTKDLIDIVVQSMCQPQIAENFLNLRKLWVGYTENVYGYNKPKTKVRKSADVDHREMKKTKEAMVNSMGVLLMAHLWLKNNPNDLLTGSDVTYHKNDHRMFHGTVIKVCLIYKISSIFSKLIMNY